MASCRIAAAAAFFMLAAAPAFAEEMGVIQPLDASPFPDLLYKDADGNGHQLKKELGKLTLVHFWATWCVPCVAELPVVDKLAAKYSGKGLKVISISEDGSTHMKKVQEFYAQHKITTLPALLDVGTMGFESSKARGLPTSFILDKDGNKIAITEGPVDWLGKDAGAFIEGHLK